MWVTMSAMTQERTPVPLPNFCPRTLIGVPPKDFSVTTGDHLLLDVGLSNEQLCHGSFVAVLCDPSDSHPFAYYKTSQMVSSSSGWRWLSSLAT
jgi:hypothetical protein